ncbi:MAG: hypothetical protein GF330_06905 [Candidatus Eisenbacteria bacterium]|nr:hypothetical protein [Candidatus Eisenbacteria bacterium]
MRVSNWMNIDRRWIFLAMGLAIVVPLLLPMRLPMGVQEPTQGLFDAVDAIDPEKQCLLISSDYTPQTEAENHPMTVALLRHAFARRIPVISVVLYIEAAGLIDAAVKQVMAEFNARATTHADSIIYGRDVAFLGWQPPPIVPILSMGESITGIYPVDFYGTPSDSLPMMARIQDYDDVGIVAALSSSSSPLWYVMFAQTKFGVPVGAGCTAVMAPDFYPYLETGQLSGMMGGMKGAAEYEVLVERNFGITDRARANEGMGSQSIAHVVIMAFVVVGNIAFFATRRKEGQA